MYINHIADISETLRISIAEYAERNPRSAAQFMAAQHVMPGGNTRSVLFYEPFPLTFVKGRGTQLWDIDGHSYGDFLGEYTAGLYGHSNSIIKAAIKAAIDRGLNLSGHNDLEAQLAVAICERIGSIELVRFTNSGTEANLMALAVAKAFTGRSKIMVFEGGYHGGVLTFSEGASKVNVPHEFILAPYNDPERARYLIAAHADDLAAVLVEPMLGAGGCIPGDTEFLFLLRKMTEEVGCVLIFDEVMTSRLAYGGRQQILGINPDMTTIGKFYGGGLSFGAFGGRRDIMQWFDPRRRDRLSHAGTFNNNTLAMAAGIAGLRHVFTAEAAVCLNELGDQLRAQLNVMFKSKGVNLQFTGLGSLMNLHATADPITRPADLRHVDQTLRDIFFFDLVAQGFYVAPRGLVTVSLPTTLAETSRFVGAVAQFIDLRFSLLRL